MFWNLAPSILESASAATEASQLHVLLQPAALLTGHKLKRQANYTSAAHRETFIHYKRPPAHTSPWSPVDGHVPLNNPFSPQWFAPLIVCSLHSHLPATPTDIYTMRSERRWCLKGAQPKLVHPEMAHTCPNTNQDLLSGKQAAQQGNSKLIMFTIDDVFHKKQFWSQLVLLGQLTLLRSSISHTPSKA